MTKSEIKDLRDLVYEQVSGDNNWAACHEYWATPENVQWLLKHKPETKQTETNEHRSP